MKTAQRLLLDLARRLETEYPSAAESVREGRDETLTVLTLKLSPRLPLARDDERRGESDQPDAPREAQRQAVARWADDAAVGGGRHPRSREGLSSPQRACLHADSGQRLRARDRWLGLVAAEDDRQVA